MALAPKYAGLRLAAVEPSEITTSPKHTIELYLDYACPFSKMLFNTFWNSVTHTIDANYSDKVTVIFRLQIQPWHPGSLYCAEAALAVLAISPSSFWEFSHVLFQRQTEFFDVAVANETRNKTYKRLAIIAKDCKLDGDDVYAKLKVGDQPIDGSYNIGNKVTNDIKTMVKMHRLVGVHVTPKVIVNGLVQEEIDSKFTAKQWDDFLRNLVK